MWLKTWFPVARDVASFGLGSWGVIHEELSGAASIPLLVVWTTLLGVPGTFGALWLSRTGSGSSPSPPEPSEPRPP